MKRCVLTVTLIQPGGANHSESGCHNDHRQRIGDLRTSAKAGSTAHSHRGSVPTQLRASPLSPEQGNSDFPPHHALGSWFWGIRSSVGSYWAAPLSNCTHRCLLRPSCSRRPCPPAAWASCARAPVQPCPLPQHPGAPRRDAPALRVLSQKRLLCSVPSFPIPVITSVRCCLSPSLTLQESAVASLSICRRRRLLGCALPFPQFL